MKKKATIIQTLSLLCLLLSFSPISSALKAPTKSLEYRVQAAELVFVGTVINKVIDGDWVRAELLVEEPLVNTKQAEKIAVTWRTTIGNIAIYDTAEGSHGIAILKDMRKGRYWLRSDKFETLDKIDSVKEVLELVQ